MEYQAQNLRDFVRQHHSRARVLAVTSGKGGVGKTSTSVNLGIAMAAQGQRVTVLDADLGLANVEVLLGLNSLYNLQHVIAGERRMRQIVVQGPGGIDLIPGSSGIAKLADLGPHARENVIRGLMELQEDADFIIIDTMAGIGQNAVAFAAAADEVLLVTTPEPSAIVDAYAMLKTINQLRKDAVIRIVVNMAANAAQANMVAAKLNHVAQQYLGRSLATLGHILRDPHVAQAVMQATPFVLRYPAAPAAKNVQDLAAALLRQKREQERGRPGFLRRIVQNLGLVSNA
ncbi:MAG TPA: MinD/ParA family protein [Candidatus Hydrogenedentes bacterium]|nr:MinD/ParA family protein [Candidatus Hydrogenedentota bacterium]HOS02307.1 MinD/ParA family protein [Candidatus Hydrogenedentota bacterium]